MRISVIIFIIGVIMLIGGILLAVAAPATVTWKPKSRVLADEKTLTVSPGWTSESEELTDEVCSVSTWRTYDYDSALTPYHVRHREAKDVVISGNAIEQSSPQLWFNFYIFDGVNFDLWKADKTCTTFYEAEGKTSTSFNFSIAEENVPDWFYFVVEEYVLGVKPTVRITATINWVEKASIYDCSEYFTSLEFIFEKSKNFTLEGTATEVNNYHFNFYILSSTNYFNWKSGEAHTSYYEVKNVTTTSFFISLTEDEAESFIYFVAENVLLDVNETVKVSATLEWNEKAIIAATIGGWILGGIIAFLGIIVIIIAGVAALVFKPKAPAPTPPTPPT